MEETIKNSKVCTKCLIEQPVTEFHKNKQQGRLPSCRKCCKEYRDNPTNKKRKSENGKKNYNKNKERIKVRHKKWFIKNRAKWRTYQLNYLKKRRKTDPAFRLRFNLQNRFSWLLKQKNIDKNISCRDLIGLSLREFRKYLESKFEIDMSWENYGKGAGKWSIDHILPCELFDFSDERQQRICCHYSNLLPKWHIDNQTKLDILPDKRFARNLSKEEKLDYLRSLGYLNYE